MPLFLRFFGRFGRWALLVGYAAASAAIGFGVRFKPIAVHRIRRPGPSSAADLLAMGVVIAASSGVLSAALVETYKRLGAARGHYHQYELQQYFRETMARQLRYTAARPVSPPPGGTPDAADLLERPWHQLSRALGSVWPTQEEVDDYAARELPPGTPRSSARRFAGHARRNPRYFFALPLEQVMGQIASALEIALVTPQDYYELLRCFVGVTASEDELDRLVAASRRLRTDATRPTGSPDTDEQDEELTAMRAVAYERVQRGIDAIQVIIGHRWRWFVRGTAAGVCGILGILAAKAAGSRGGARVLVWLLCAGPGAAFAWLARDAAAVIERWRR